MLDVSTASPTRETTLATALVTRAGGDDLEVRVWPPEDVWAVARGLDLAGLSWEPALPDESGLPGSLVLPGSIDPSTVLAALELPGVAALGYLAADEAGTCHRVPGAEPVGRDGVVFVELRQCVLSGGWRVRAFGALGALRRLREAARPLCAARPGAARDFEALLLELVDRPGIVTELVERLDAAGLDGHVRVLRRHQGC